ncbi:hypothetical protein [Microcoleus sp. AR_TQ3_B6]
MCCRSHACPNFGDSLRDSYASRNLELQTILNLTQGAIDTHYSGSIAW